FRLAARAETLIKRRTTSASTITGADSTGAGTPSSTAVLMVQRPSPESDTRPANFETAGSSANAAAVKSSSQATTTLPPGPLSGQHTALIYLSHARGESACVISTQPSGRQARRSSTVLIAVLRLPLRHLRLGSTLWDCCDRSRPSVRVRRSHW